MFFGAWAELEDDSGVRKRYRIVGADETDAAAGLISVDSPLAQQLLKKQVGDSVEVELPAGTRRYMIISIRYA